MLRRGPLLCRLDLDDPGVLRELLRLQAGEPLADDEDDVAAGTGGPVDPRIRGSVSLPPPMGGLGLWLQPKRLMWVLIAAFVAWRMYSLFASAPRVLGLHTYDDDGDEL
jgi:hypothetical protein